MRPLMTPAILAGCRLSRRLASTQSTAIGLPVMVKPEQRLCASWRTVSGVFRLPESGPLEVEWGGVRVRTPQIKAVGC